MLQLHIDIAKRIQRKRASIYLCSPGITALEPFPKTPTPRSDESTKFTVHHYQSSSSLSYPHRTAPGEATPTVLLTSPPNSVTHSLTIHMPCSFLTKVSSLSQQAQAAQQPRSRAKSQRNRKSATQIIN